MRREGLEYQRVAPRREFARPRPGSVTAWLIFLNVFAYVADGLITSWTHMLYRLQPPGRDPLYLQPLRYWGYFSTDLAVHHLQLWRFVTFQFLHANFDHLVFNMLALFFFGPMVERYLTSRLYAVYYLLCGVGGAVMYLLLVSVGVASSWMPLIGASAGIFGVLIAAAMIAPNAIALVFGFFPARLRTVVWVFIAYAVFQVLFRGQNAGGEAAHLGGAAVGFLLMRRPGVLERIAWLGKRAPPF